MYRSILGSLRSYDLQEIPAFEFTWSFLQKLLLIL